jgi:hypothetical protein
VNQVKIYDGKGNLKKIIQPVFDYEGTSRGNTTNKPCRFCGKIANLLGTQKFCTVKCGELNKQAASKRKREEKNRLRAAKPSIPCQQCGEPVAPRRRKYCGKVCDSKARKLIAMAKHTRTAEIIKNMKVKHNIKKVSDLGNVI